MKKRVSIITDDMGSCYNCGSVQNIEIHEIYFGSQRDKSIKYGLVVPLCPECHKGTYGVHGSKGRMLNISLKEHGQIAFEKKFPDLDFLKIFGRNYL